MEYIEFQQLDLQLPPTKMTLALPATHPLHRRFEAYKEDIEYAKAEGNENLVAVIYITMAMELAACEN